MELPKYATAIQRRSNANSYYIVVPRATVQHLKGMNLEPKDLSVKVTLEV